MRCTMFIAGFALLGLSAGCGQAPKDGQQVENGSQDAVVPEGGPEIAVHRFLEAVKAGDDERSAQMLTSRARQKTAEYNMIVAPPGSDTASFKVGEIEMLGEDGAHVASFWTDVDEHGEKHTDAIIWMVRKEAEGWRIAGMATRIFEDKPAMILNFEEPEEMLAKQQQMEADMSRHASAEIAEKGGTASADSRSKVDTARQKLR